MAHSFTRPVTPPLGRSSVRSVSNSYNNLLFSNNTIIPLEYFLSCAPLAKILILHSFPKAGQSGRAYEETLLGSILQKSCLPPVESGQWEFFSQPSGQPASVHSATEGRIWSGLESVHSAGHFIIKQLLKLSEDTKHYMLLWIGSCLAANQARGKMWTNQSIASQWPGL